MSGEEHDAQQLNKKKIYMSIGVCRPFLQTKSGRIRSCMWILRTNIEKIPGPST
jgi:hypothetical protein